MGWIIALPIFTKTGTPMIALIVGISKHRSTGILLYAVLDASTLTIELEKPCWGY